MAALGIQTDKNLFFNNNLNVHVSEGMSLEHLCENPPKLLVVSQQLYTIYKFTDSIILRIVYFWSTFNPQEAV